VPALLQAFLRLVALKRLGVLLFVLAATLCAASTASAFEPAQTKTRVWGFNFAEYNSCGLFRAASNGKHQGNRVALSELASDSLLAAEGVGAEISSLPRIGSGLKVDFVKPIRDAAGNIIKEFPATPIAHGFPNVVDNFAGAASQFELRNGANLFQLEGSLNGVAGRFEWIVDQGSVTHRMFVGGGSLNGVPIVP
jgi:hypothetical protein